MYVKVDQPRPVIYSCTANARYRENTIFLWPTLVDPERAAYQFAALELVQQGLTVRDIAELLRIGNGAAAAPHQSAIR